MLWFCVRKLLLCLNSDRSFPGSLGILASAQADTKPSADQAAPAQALLEILECGVGSVFNPKP